MSFTGVRINCGQFEAAANAIAAQLDRERVALEADSGEETDVLVTLLVPPHRLEEALTPEVRWVHVLGAGVDGFPMDLLGSRVLTCSRGASAGAIAEWTVAQMLAFEKQIPESWVTEPPPTWHTASLGGLAAKSLGLVGVGSIGGEIARLARAFGMEVSATRRSQSAQAPDGVRIVANLMELVAASDHVVLAAPATAETNKLINAEVFAAMRPSAHLVNVARASLLDQDALHSALNAGQLARATLDVMDPEPLPAGHWLYNHPRVRLSPHISWSAPDTMARTIALFLENLRRWRSGQPLEGVVRRVAGY